MGIQRLGAMSVVLLAASLGTSPCFAQVNRCGGPDGKIEFSNAPCSAGSTGGLVRVKPNTINTSGSREQALRLENDRLREQLGNAQRTSQQPVEPPATAQRQMGGPGPDCSNALRTYDNAATTRVKSNLIDMEIARTAAEEACGKRVPKMREQIVAEDAEEKRRLRQAVVQFCSLNPNDQRCRP